MDVFQCIRRRRTIRDFKPDPVPDDVVHKILQAARWAPSSSNTQPWHFVVVRNRETITELGRICTQGAFIGQAPLAIAVVMGETRRPHLDAGRALQQMELMAWSEGLGTCFVGIRGEQQTEVKTLLGIPEDMELITVLPFGYRIMRPAGTGTPRKPMSEITHGERFGEKLTFG
jgi:nitroreductase